MGHPIAWSASARRRDNRRWASGSMHDFRAPRKAVFPRISRNARARLGGRAGISHAFFFERRAVTCSDDGNADRSPLQRKRDGPRSREWSERDEAVPHDRGRGDRGRCKATRRRFRSACRSTDGRAADRCTRLVRATCRRHERGPASGRMCDRHAGAARASGAIVRRGRAPERAPGPALRRKSGQGIHRSRRASAGIFRR